MNHEGVSFMIDHWSTTARLVVRKWAPRFDYIFTQQALSTIDEKTSYDNEIFDAFLETDTHEVLYTSSDDFFIFE